MFMWLVAVIVALAASSTAQGWEVHGYYPDYRRSVLPAPADMAAQLGGCLLHFSLTPQADGTLTGMSAARMQEMTSGAPCSILVIGGGGRGYGFRSAPINTLVANIVAAAKNYDGVDIDWEPLNNYDDERAKVAGDPQSGRWQPFMRALAQALPASKRLSIAVGYQHENNKDKNLARMVGDVAPLVDRLNLMGYGMSGPWPGWMTWPLSPFTNGGYTFPGLTKPMPSVELMVQRYEAVRVPRNKMMLGVAFFCHEWHGVTGPRQTWTSETTPWRSGEYQYKTAMAAYAGVPRIWDGVTRTPYWSINQPGKRRYLTCDDRDSIKLKRDWGMRIGLAGIFAWELSGAPLSFLR